MGIWRRVKLLCKTRWTRHHRLFAFRPIQLSVSPSAKIDIQHGLFVNKPWNEYHKNHLGVFQVDDNAVVECDDFTIHYKCHVGVHKNAVLKLSTGYMNTGCRLDCANSISIGEHTVIAHEVIIRDSDAHTIRGSEK